MIKVIFNFFITLIIFCLCFTYLTAQPFENERPLEKFRTLKKVKLLEELNLNESESEKFLIKYNSAENLIIEKQENFKKALDDLEIAMKNKKSVKEILELTNKVVDAHNELLKARAKKFEEVKKVLNNEQFAKFLVFEKNFMEQIRDLMKEGPKFRKFKEKNR